MVMVYSGYSPWVPGALRPALEQRNLTQGKWGNTPWLSGEQVSDTHELGCEDAEAGPRLNIKTVLSTYGDFQVKDKTAVRTSYL